MWLSVEDFYCIGIGYIISLIIHEVIHFETAKLFQKKNVRLNLLKLQVTYERSNDYIGNAVISASPHLVFAIAIVTLNLLKLPNQVQRIYFIIALLNLINLIPLFQDGKEIIVNVWLVVKGWANL